MVERHALLIDTISYVSLPNFQYSRGSATELGAALEDRDIGDYVVTTLMDARFDVIPLDVISAAISDHFQTATANSELLLYLSGHLLSDGTPNGLYLGLTDTVKEKVVETGYPLLSLRKVLIETRARSVVILLDGYYSMPMTDVSLEPTIASIFGQFGKPSALHFAMLFSLLEVGLPDDPARPPSFSWGVIEGVSGAADLDRDGVVTVADLHDYLIQYLDQPPSFISNSDPRQFKVSAVPPPPGEDLVINPCPNCLTQGGHGYRVPVQRFYIHYFQSPGPSQTITREFHVVFRCPVNDKSFAVTLRLQEDPQHDPISGVGHPLLRPPRTGKMSEDQVEQTPRVEVVPRSAAPLTLHEEALIDAGRQMFAESGQVSRDFAKQMITVASTAIPVYLGLLGATGLSHRSPTAVLLVSLPSLALLLSILLFVLALLPRRGLVSLQVLDQLSDARERFLRTRYRWIQIGLTVFGSAVIGAIASALTLMSTSR